MTIYFTSDTHFYHTNTLRYCGRPFFTRQQCDEAMIARWNSIVKPEDTVYHLGDVAMHIKPMARILPRLNGRKILIVGNHDLMYGYFIKTRGQKFVDRMTAEYTAAGFIDIHKSNKEICFDLGTHKVLVRLSHFPTKNCYDPNHQDKHDASKPEDTGIVNICGHVHQAWLKRGNNINVGVDVWDFTPVSLDAVLNLWYNGKKNIEAPKQIRIFVWKLYHTAVYKIKTIFSKDKR
jgi:calcineurin-like phosphoesterase family protein